MNTRINLISASLALCCATAQAGVIVVGGTPDGSNGEVSSRPGVCTVDFNLNSAANSCGATYSQNGGAPLAAVHLRSGSVGGQYAAPAGDTSVFLTVGTSDGSPITITLATAANYFGFYAGSLDSYNEVQFFLNGTMVDSFNGSQIDAVAFPSTAADGSNTAYIDYLPTSFYNSIVYSSSENAFETDNHAFGIVAGGAAAPVPEPASVLLIGVGALALMGVRRRKF